MKLVLIENYFYRGLLDIAVLRILRKYQELSWHSPSVFFNVLTTAALRIPLARLIFCQSNNFLEENTLINGLMMEIFV